MEDRKNILKFIDSISSSDLGSYDDSIHISKFNETIIDVLINKVKEIDADYFSVEDEYESSFSINFYKKVPETDEQMHRRLFMEREKREKMERMKEDAEYRDRMAYQRLKKKYEGK